MGQPLVSIVILTKNRHELVRGAVRSALAQTVPDLEVIVVDDGSTEPVGIEEDDSRVRLIRNERSVGMSAARNIGLREARGRYITYLDDDDELLPRMVEVSLHTIAGSALAPPVASMTGMMVVNVDGTLHETRLPVTLPHGALGILTPVERGTFKADNTLVVPTEVLREVGGWDERLVGVEKWELFLRLNPRCSIQGCDEITYRMLNHHGARVHKQWAAHAEGLVLMDQKHASLLLHYRPQRARFLSSASIYFLKGGRWGRAIRTGARALAYDPRSGRLWFRLGAALGGPPALALYRGARDRLRRLRRGGGTGER